MAGAGWPSTIDPGTDDLARGAVLLAAALALVAWLKPEGRRAPPQILLGATLVVLALIASSSTAVAKGQFLSWQNWDFYNKPGKAVNVAYIWRADYNGVHFPKNRTRVFTVQASPRSVYWRATTLDAFVKDHWDEDLIPLSLDDPSGIVGLWGGDALLPFAAANQSHWQGAAVTIDALHDRHLVGPTQPVQYVTSGLSSVEFQRGGIAVASDALSRGEQYSVWGYEPQPTPAALARSPADYPFEISTDSEYLRLPHSNAVPTFRSPEYNRWAAYYFSTNRDGRRYRPLYLAARRVAGKARNPYAAAIALEAWFRSAGGFVYDEQPPHTQGVPPLVDFVTKTKRGYCQHFAGAMALMLRYLGIPARVGAGFTSGTYDEKNKTWTVYDRDAHTWVEVWFKGYGWLAFDPTPSRGTLGGPYTTSSLSFDAPGAVKVLKASAMPARQLLRSELGSQSKAARAKAKAADPGLSGKTARARGGSGQGSSIAAVVLVAGLGLLLLFIVVKTVLRRQRYLTGDPRRVAAAARRDLVGFLLDQRIAVPRSIGPRELGTFLGTRAGIEATDFADALGRARFGPDADAAAAARQARRELRAVRRRLRHVLPLGRRVRGLFSFRSLLTSA
jgi:transglutaminase-like putative cysteine protease